MDLIIVGAGLSGAVVANKLAKSGKKVLILEKRENVGGNVYDEKMGNIFIQKYGPHIFHTNNEKVMNFMKPYMKLNNFKNRVEANIKGKILPIPFNFKGIETFWPEEADEIKQKLISKYGLDKRVGVLELINQNDDQLKKVANFVFENIFKNYTEKMWGVPIERINKEILSRVPVVIGYQDRYFSDKYEGIPIGGFTSVIAKLLDHDNIEIRLGINAKDVLLKKDGALYFEGKKVNIPVVYTGSLDEFLDYKYGDLGYRSLNIVFENLNINSFQKTAVVNYPADPKMTRISEYKKLYEENDLNNTVISREYPGMWDKNSKEFNEPYYPLTYSEKDKEIHKKYLDIAQNKYNLIPLGRLAEYKYINMDQAIDSALILAEKLLGE